MLTIGNLLIGTLPSPDKRRLKIKIGKNYKIFKDIFRSAKVLIIDDIQFVSGKDVTQEEFFHTFNALIESGSQIVISCDRPPNELDRIQDRIKSRLSGGLVVDIQSPDFEQRVKILKIVPSLSKSLR